MSEYYRMYGSRAGWMTDADWNAHVARIDKMAAKWKKLSKKK